MADTQYVIEIASQLSGVDATAAELDSLASKLDGSGANAAMFEDALAQLAGDLDAARAASASASSALAEGQTQYAQLERAAIRASTALERIENKTPGLRSAQDQLSSLQGQLDAAVSAGAPDEEIANLTAEVNRAAIALREIGDTPGLNKARAASTKAAAAARDYAGELDRLEQEAKQAAAAQSKLSKTMSNASRLQGRVRDRLGDATTNLSTFRGALGDIGGPLGEFGERLLFPAQAFVDLNEKFGRGVAIATVAGFGLAAVVAAVTVAFLAVGVALVAATVKLVTFAIKTSDAARSMDLARESAAALNPALRGIPWGDISRETGVAGARLDDIATSLSDAGVASGEMAKALRAVALAETALGGAGKADKFIADLAAGKMSVDEFAATVESKLGDKVARQLLSLEAQGVRFKMNTGEMFKFDVEPALEGLSVLVDLFDRNTVAGRAMRDALEGVLDPIIRNAKKAAQVVEAFVLGFMIGMARIYIMVAPTVREIAKLFGIDASDWEFSDVLDAAATAGKALAVAIAVVAGVVVTAAAIIVVGFKGIAAAILGVPFAIALFVADMIKAAPKVAAFARGLAQSVASGVASAIAALAGAVSGFVDAGGDLIKGLVRGIMAGTASVVSAITSVASSAVDAAKKTLGIASPSKIFEGIGGDVGEGFAGGVSDSEDSAHAAVRSLTSPRAAGDNTTTTTTNTSSSRASTIVIERVEFPGGADAVEAFRAWLEGMALQGASS